MFLSKLFSWPRHVLHGPRARRTHSFLNGSATWGSAGQQFGHKFWRLACDTLFDIIEPERGYGQTKMEATANSNSQMAKRPKGSKAN